MTGDAPDPIPDAGPDLAEERDLPVVEPPDVDPPDLDSPNLDPPDVGAGEVPARSSAAEGPVAGVLLAAGTSSRFGDANKLLAELDGEPVVRRAARSISGAGVEPRLAVVGHDADRVRDAVAGLGFSTVQNPAYREGQAASVRAAVEALRAAGASATPEVRDDVAAAVFALGDLPLVDPASVAKLVAAYRDGAGSALAAACDGERGNPVLFDGRHFDALAGVGGDAGGRAVLLGAADAALVETGDPGVRLDVDTPADLERLRRE